MNKIKFSYRFLKLIHDDSYPVEKCRLLQVLPVDLADLSQVFIDYDTDNSTYPLPVKGDYLLLIFQKMDLKGYGLFTTLRRSTPQKLEYYQNQVGQLFEVVVQEKEPAV